MPAVPDSILDSIKKLLGIDSGYTAFDEDIKIHINSVFSSLEQLAIGPEGGFVINGSTETWAAYLGDDLPKLSAVKSLMYLRVRLLFDPPATSFGISSFQSQIDKLEWTLNVQKEGETQNV